ncbi:MAG: S41 family peptidase [Alistipes sp.]|nr:S41 family peptidase [Alistipes sp.]
MSSKRSKILRCAIIALVACTIFLGGWYSGNRAGRRISFGYLSRMVELTQLGNKLDYTMALIGREYVDDIAVDTLVERLMPQLMEQLDPHSVYIPAEDLQEVNEPLEGEFDGIGVVFNMATDTVIVLNVIPAGPGDKAGIRNGDRIMRIDDSLVAGRKIPQTDIVKRLRGPRGTEVKLSLARQGIGSEVEVTVERGAIPLKSIESAFMTTPETGYIKLSQFARSSTDELLAAIASLREQGMKHLIFDLRGNTGGYLDQAIAIANEFLPDGKLIVYTEDRNGNRVEEFSDGSGGSDDLDLAVLIDEASASSSEILAGALQDNDRGTIIGRRSFGKGLVQRQIPFTDGSAIRLTVARYFTPTGRSIQKPYETGDGDSYNEDIANRFLHNEFFSADSIRFADSLRFTTPAGKTVYGGGGIMPDIFVPLDTADMTRYFLEVSGRNIIYRYTIDYADRHRAELDRIETLDQLRAYLDADTSLLDDFVRYAERNGVKPDRHQIAVSRKLITAQLRAYISRNTKLESDGFYDNIHPIDNTVQRAIEFLEKR